MNNFEDLFENHSEIITDKVLEEYSKNWIKPKFPTDELNQKDDKVFEPHGAQIEALYLLNQSREEGYKKALIVATTGI